MDLVNMAYPGARISHIPERGLTNAGAHFSTGHECSGYGYLFPTGTLGYGYGMGHSSNEVEEAVQTVGGGMACWLFGSGRYITGATDRRGKQVGKWVSLLGSSRMITVYRGEYGRVVLQRFRGHHHIMSGSLYIQVQATHMDTNTDTNTKAV